MPFSIWIQLLLHLRLLYNSAMPSFYQEILAELDWARDARVLVVCGDALDREVFLACGFCNVTISNVDERIQDHGFFAPYSWSYQDAENLKFPDNAFDYAVVHAGLHHCASPHRALLEMYRIASQGVLCFEARDSALMRMGKRLGLVPDYELAAVTANQQRWGGVRNTCVPNYVYRWTENEVEKTIASNAPHAPHTVRYSIACAYPMSVFHSPIACLRGERGGWPAELAT